MTDGPEPLKLKGKQHHPGLKVSTESGTIPRIEAIPLVEAITQLEIPADIVDHDAAVAHVIAAAVSWIEGKTGRPLMRRRARMEGSGHAGQRPGH